MIKKEKIIKEPEKKEQKKSEQLELFIDKPNEETNKRDGFNDDESGNEVNKHDDFNLEYLIIPGMTIGDACNLFKQAIERKLKGDNSDVVICSASEYKGGNQDVDKQLQEENYSKPLIVLDEVITVYKFKNEVSKNSIMDELEKSKKPVTYYMLDEIAYIYGFENINDFRKQINYILQNRNSYNPDQLKKPDKMLSLLISKFRISIFHRYRVHGDGLRLIDDLIFIKSIDPDFMMFENYFSWFYPKMKDDSLKNFESINKMFIGQTATFIGLIIKYKEGFPKIKLFDGVQTFIELTIPDGIYAGCKQTIKEFDVMIFQGVKKYQKNKNDSRLDIKKIFKSSINEIELAKFAHEIGCF